MSDIISKPDNIDLPDDKEWSDMSPELRYYYRNKNEWVGRVGQRKQKLREWVRSKQVEIGCIECGEDHPACLHWHHNDPEDKDRSPMKMAHDGLSKGNIEKEIEKCIVLCANCHAKVHWEEQY